MCGQQSKGRTDKQAGSWASTGPMSLGNRPIALWNSHTCVDLLLTQRLTSGWQNWHCNLYVAKSTIISAFLLYYCLGRGVVHISKQPRGFWWVIDILSELFSLQGPFIMALYVSYIDMYGRSAMGWGGSGGVAIQWGMIEAWHGGNGVFTDMGADITIIHPF